MREPKKNEAPTTFSGFQELEAGVRNTKFSRTALLRVGYNSLYVNPEDGGRIFLRNRIIHVQD